MGMGARIQKESVIGFLCTAPAASATPPLEEEAILEASPTPCQVPELLVILSSFTRSSSHKCRWASFKARGVAPVALAREFDSSSCCKRSSLQEKSELQEKQERHTTRLRLSGCTILETDTYEQLI